MLEHLKLKALNIIVGITEKKTVDEGIIFVPQNRQLREISEALLIEGVNPSEINDTVLKLSQEILKDDKENTEALLAQQLADIGSALKMEGADQWTINQQILAARKILLPDQKQSFLNEYQPVKKVKLGV